MQLNTEMSLPSSGHLFLPAEGPSSIVNHFSTDMNGVTKLNGTGDSAGKRSSVKAPGGHDAAQSRDGG